MVIVLQSAIFLAAVAVLELLLSSVKIIFLAIVEGWISNGFAVKISTVDGVDKVNEISSSKASGVYCERGRALYIPGASLCADFHFLSFLAPSRHFPP